MDTLSIVLILEKTVSSGNIIVNKNDKFLPVLQLSKLLFKFYTNFILYLYFIII